MDVSHQLHLIINQSLALNINLVVTGEKDTFHDEACVCCGVRLCYPPGKCVYYLISVSLLCHHALLPHDRV